MNLDPSVGRLSGVFGSEPQNHGTSIRQPSIVLASASPRRRELLAGMGLAFDVMPADIDESARAEEDPVNYVDRLAHAKALAIAERMPVDSGHQPMVIAADTVVVIDGVMLGKPRDNAENRAFLDRLSGRVHQVSTGHCVMHRGVPKRAVRTTDVTFRALSGGERARYVATGEGADKAGGYAIQGIGAALVERIDGCYFNVVGMSVATIVILARELGITLV